MSIYLFVEFYETPVRRAPDKWYVMYELNNNDKVVIVSHAHCDNKENTLLEKEFEVAKLTL